MLWFYVSLFNVWSVEMLYFLNYFSFSLGLNSEIDFSVNTPISLGLQKTLRTPSLIFFPKAIEILGIMLIDRSFWWKQFLWKIFICRLSTLVIVICINICNNLCYNLCTFGSTRIILTGYKPAQSINFYNSYMYKYM